MHVISLWILCLLLVSPVISKKHEIQLVDNGYTGLKVVISDKVPETAGLVDRIKTAFTDASSLLYSATKNLVYFKEITIVVPKSWSSSTQYTTSSGSVSSSMDFLVDTAKPETGNTPYVHGLTKCGGQGLYAHVTPELMLTSQSIGYGPIEKILVHEWAHLRWGVFDEYPSAEQPNMDENERFYNEDGTWKPVMCTEKILGSNLRDCSNSRSRCFVDPDGKPESDCQFCVQVPNSARASLMAFQWISSVVEFCDENTPSVDEALRHNSRAPNDQNRYCGQRSVWEVMRTHSDFNASNTAGTSTKSTTPEFTVVQEGELRLALVLDISNSMNAKIVGPSRLQLLQDIVGNFLKYTLPDNSDVGIVTFSSGAQIVTSMTTVTSDAVRESLVQDLPSTAFGYTALGDGLLKGLEVLNTTANLNGATIILLTDGKENRRPLVADVLPILVSSGVTVHSLAISSSSDGQLTSISQATGGRSFFYSESSTSTALQDAFAGILEESSAPVQIDSQSLSVQGGSPVTGQFYLDSTVGLNTVLQVIVNDTSSVSVRVTGPDGTTYTDSSGSSVNSVNRNVAVSGTAAAGRYTYTVTSGTDLKGTLIVQSGRKDNTTDGLVVRSWTSEKQYSYGQSSTFTVYASVLRNKSPVLRTTVTANLENEDGVSVAIGLKDDGVGSDLRADDGVYSGTVLPRYVTLDGRLSVKVTAATTDGTAKVLATTSGSGAAPLSGSGNTVTLSNQENFQRVSQTGELLVQNYVPGSLPDVIPPAKITTLSLTSVDDTSGVIQVTWKAVGDDIDDGTAAVYDVRLSTDINALMTNPGSTTQLTSQLPTPKVSGQVETFTFTLPVLNRDGRTYYLAIRAIDDSQNTGELSNIVSLSLVTDVNWLPTTTQATQTTTPTTTAIPRIVYNSDQSILIGLSTAAGVAAIGLILFGISMSCCFGRWKRVPPRENLPDDVESGYISRRHVRKGHSRRQRGYNNDHADEIRDNRRSRHKREGYLDVYSIPGLTPYDHSYSYHGSSSSNSMPYNMYR
ncbi:calcium-activated chloride channel regulator 1-like [Ylistrum balloti]|uniref:calcium-activated chloride channel regulator 1-like n=1 Tax=Ylistrum balloti TaxID=509963 RepID=UPI002905C6C2|nr:calcium-activated chloride channel regulator 1-like [Ylistrum balloti]